ncbi:hypothetical protein GMORB2_1048 [Geosmithia morbida]|uniref:Uncharacterized protein n=1 Tax=Geosmithia morbida TaxID=1094350 RepID=A0A9P4Z0B0_9HYPO|nr:uncharacterized protein GMORB2_1048 [Geosmithia morbida]KAF4125802.1 hypothetical protein GMORB2_1048 [Geosmithia morbida]
MSTPSSYADLRDLSPNEDKDDIDSLPSLSTTDIYSETESEAQEEWERSLEQLQLLLTMIVVPFVGKFFGRKFAYWSWTRYMGWVHNVQVRITSPKTFNAVGAAEVAATL